jgi:hypothetical protein
MALLYCQKRMRSGWDDTISHDTQHITNKRFIGGEGGIRIYPLCDFSNDPNESAPTEAIESIEFLDRRT